MAQRMWGLRERVELTAETTQGRTVGPQSDDRGTQLEDHDDAGGSRAHSPAFSSETAET
jgi:hypothetical protein